MPASVRLSVPTGEAIASKPSDPSPRSVQRQKEKFSKEHKETIAKLTVFFEKRIERQNKEISSFKKLEEEMAEEFGEHWLSQLEEEHPELAKKYKEMKGLSEKPRLPEPESKSDPSQEPSPLEQLKHELFEALAPKLQINIVAIPTTPKSAIHVEKTSKKKQVRFAEPDESDPAPKERTVSSCLPMLYTAFLVAGVILTVRRFYFPDLR